MVTLYRCKLVYSYLYFFCIRPYQQWKTERLRVHAGIPQS